MSKIPKRLPIDLLFGELYAYNYYGEQKWFGVPTEQISNGEYRFLTEDGYKMGEAKYCTRIWENSLLEKYKKLKDEARGK